MKLVLAVIMKDEEKHIGNLIDSVKDIIDFFVFVDTGSTDSTVGIISEKLLVSQYSLHKKTWNDDFSEARNYSFQLAKDIGYDWLLWLDCDDTFPTISNLKTYLSKELPEDINCIFLPYHYFHDEQGRLALTHPRERLFKWGTDPIWVDPIHEGINVAPYKIMNLDFPVIHNRTAEDMQSDLGRNLRMLKKFAKKDSPRFTYYYAKELFHAGKLKKAIVVFNLRLQQKGYIDEEFSSMLFLSEISIQGGNFREAIDWASKSLEIYDDVPDSYYLMGIAYAELKRPNAAIHMFESCLKCAERGNFLVDQQGTIYGGIGTNIRGIRYKTGYQLGIYLPRTYIEPLQHLEKLYFEVGLNKECYNCILKIIEYYKDKRVIEHDYKLLGDILRKRIPDSKREGKLKLNIGSGTQELPGYINIDRYDEHADYMVGVEELDLEPFSCESIFTCHFLEHLDKLEYEKVMYHISRLVHPGGNIEIAVPDFDECCERYLSYSNRVKKDDLQDIRQSTVEAYKDWYRDTIYGRQITDGRVDLGQFHKTGHNEITMRDGLERLGFRIVSCEKYDGYGTPSIRVKAIKKLICMVEELGEGDINNPTNRLRHLIKFLKIKNGYKSNINIAVAGMGNFDNAINNEIFPNIIVLNSFGDYYNEVIDRYKGRIKFIYDYNEAIGGISNVYETLKRVDIVACCSTKLAEIVKEGINENVKVIGDLFEDEKSDELIRDFISGK